MGVEEVGRHMSHHRCTIKRGNGEPGHSQVHCFGWKEASHPINHDKASIEIHNNSTLLDRKDELSKHTSVNPICFCLDLLD
jgi:hypothetical protein